MHLCIFPKYFPYKYKCLQVRQISEKVQEQPEYCSDKEKRTEFRWAYQNYKCDQTEPTARDKMLVLLNMLFRVIKQELFCAFFVHIQCIVYAKRSESNVRSQFDASKCKL